MESEGRRVSPRKRTHQEANKVNSGNDRSPPRTRHSPRTKNKSETPESSVGKKRKDGWTSAAPLETGKPSEEYPELSKSASQSKSKEKSGKKPFNDLLEKFKEEQESIMNGSWAEMVEEEENQGKDKKRDKDKRIPKKEERKERERRPKDKYVQSKELNESLGFRGSEERRRDRKGPPTDFSILSPKRNSFSTSSPKERDSRDRDNRRDDKRRQSPGRRSPRKRTSSFLSQASIDSFCSPNSVRRSYPKKSKNDYDYDENRTSTPERRSNNRRSAKSRLGSLAKEFEEAGPYKAKIGPPEWAKQDLRENWKEPKLGYTEDEQVIARREKDIQKGYESAAYKKYLAKVPKRNRIPNVHPRTPNKYINYSRRSWDMQNRIWRKMVHVFAGEEPESDASFLSTDNSYVESSNEGETSDQSNEGVGSPDVISTEEVNAINAEANPDRLASLLGHYDIDSRKGMAVDDNGTLQGTNSSSTTMKTPTPHSSEDNNTLTGNQKENGPTDFSGLVSAF